MPCCNNKECIFYSKTGTILGYDEDNNPLESGGCNFSQCNLTIEDEYEYDGRG